MHPAIISIPLTLLQAFIFSLQSTVYTLHSKFTTIIYRNLAMSGCSLYVKGENPVDVDLHSTHTVHCTLYSVINHNKIQHSTRQYAPRLPAFHPLLSTTFNAIWFVYCTLYSVQCKIWKTESDSVFWNFSGSLESFCVF